MLDILDQIHQHLAMAISDICSRDVGKQAKVELARDVSMLGRIMAPLGVPARAGSEQLHCIHAHSRHQIVAVTSASG
jgi:hypothetical protein